MKFFDLMLELQKELEARGHFVFMPIKIDNLDYWIQDGSKRIAAKKENNLINSHMDKIEQSDAILVANYSKGDMPNYIGAHTFLEMGFARYRGKKIFILNQLPDQKYISEELASFEGIILNGDIESIKS